MNLLRTKKNKMNKNGIKSINVRNCERFKWICFFANLWYSAVYIKKGNVKICLIANVSWHF